ncbi:MAG: hypothetical protein EOP36_15295 [Rubrivivax sp.]|nr:MAG: hypothetical protein EOP36_15295 [Rubrivivax sp.]
MNHSLYRLALAALFTGTIWSLRRQAHQKRQKALVSSRAKPEAVQTWEHEGGALPQTGSHMGPNPVLP